MSKRVPTFGEAMAGIFPKEEEQHESTKGVYSSKETGDAIKCVLILARKMALTQEEKDACNYVSNYLYHYFGITE